MTVWQNRYQDGGTGDTAGPDAGSGAGPERPGGLPWAT